MTLNTSPTSPAYGADAAADNAWAHYGTGSPFSEVIVLAADDDSGESVARDDRQAWCEALRDLLIARYGENSHTNPLVSSSLSSGARVPAVHYIPASVLALSTSRIPSTVPGAFLVILPAGMADDDMIAVLSAVTGLSSMRLGGRELRLEVQREIVAASVFWRKPLLGEVRLWMENLALAAEEEAGSDIKKFRASLLRLNSLSSDTELATLSSATRSGSGLLIPVDLPQDLLV